MRLLFPLIQTLSVFLVAFYLYCRSPAFRPLTPDWPRPRSKLGLYVVFTFIAILGNYLGVPVVQGGAIVNARAVGATLAGLLGGPVLGVLVGATAGAHRMTMGGVAALAGAVATTVEGLLAGLVHLALQQRPGLLITRRVAFATTLVGEILHMGIVLLITRPFDLAVAIAKTISIPMILLNPVGAALFMTVLLHRQRELDRVAAASSAGALRVAERTLGLMSRGFRQDVAGDMAAIIREETGAGAVCLTDTERVLGWAGIGADHHFAGTAIGSRFTRQAISEKTVVYADGIRETYDCRVSRSCPIHSAVVVPLQVEGAVLGTVQLFESEGRSVLRMNRKLVEGIGALLSSQLLLARYQEQKNLLVMSELKLAQAQIDPHFLFNSLTTIMAIIRKDPERGRELVNHLSNYFRKNLKRSSELSTLQEELEHVGAYLEIEKARFEDHLVVEIDVDPSLLAVKVPTFTLQPLIENAIKHGISEMLTPGRARIRVYRQNGVARIDVEDNAGAYDDHVRSADALGLKIVDRRIKGLVGDAYGVRVSCVPGELTRASVEVPLAGPG